MTQPDPMPEFTLKAKDELALAAINAYINACGAKQLWNQADEATKAYREMHAWQLRNPGEMKLPDHKHVPVEEL